MSQHSFKPGDRVIVSYETTIAGEMTMYKGEPAYQVRDETGWGQFFAKNLRPVAVLDEAAKPAPGGPKMREGWQPIELGFHWLKESDHTDWQVVEVVSDQSFYRLVMDEYGPDNMAHFRASCWGPRINPPEPTVPGVPPRVDGEGE